MNRKSSYSKEDLLDAGSGVLFGKENGKLPEPPMLMIDKILHISDHGGKYNRGEIVAELVIDPNLWFFKCHFINDPVMPGCLALDGLWQLLGFYLSWMGGRGRGRALGVKDLRLKGQIRPYHKSITYSLDIKKFLAKPMFMVWGDANVKINDKEIYFARNLQVGLFDNLIWDTGMDPDVDPF